MSMIKIVKKRFPNKSDEWHQGYYEYYENIGLWDWYEIGSKEEYEHRKGYVFAETEDSGDVAEW